MTDPTKTDYIALVLEADIPTPTMKHLLLTIAVLANENGKCRPSITRLAILTGLNRRTITRSLKKLEKDYWLSIDRVGTPQRRETNFYELNCFKLQLEKVSLEGRGTKPLLGAQNPHQRDTASPNTNTTLAPRPTAAPQAQAGGSGAESKVKDKVDTNKGSLFSDSDCEETDSSGSIFDLTEQEEATAVPVASDNPYIDRKYITQAEFDEATKNGFCIFDLPEVRDEPEAIDLASPFL